MKLISQSAEIWEQEAGEGGMLRHIERCGRIAYDSAANITEESAKAFVDRLIKMKHYSVLEHGTLYLNFLYQEGFADYNYFNKYWYNEYSQVKSLPEGVYERLALITTNYRVLIENNWLEDLKTKDIELQEIHPDNYKRVTAHIICSRATAQQLTRHRSMSFTMRSQRYVDPTRDKEGHITKELECIKPLWYDEVKSSTQISFKHGCFMAEQIYIDLRKAGLKPEQARAVLPNCAATELAMTGYVSAWKKVFDERVLGITGVPDPEMKALMEPLYKLFKEKGYLND